MQRYYFHVRDGSNMPDEIGTELTDDDAARASAIIASGEFLKDLGGKFWNSGEWIMQVVREDGGQVCKLTFDAKT
jgi:hypothetical protein